jgi:hypothetical protein
VPHHGYLWLVRRARVGAGAEAAIRLREGDGVIERREGAIAFFTPPALAVAAATIGDETRLEDGGTGAYAT